MKMKINTIHGTLVKVEIDQEFQVALSGLLKEKIEKLISNIPSKNIVYAKYPDFNKYEIESHLRKNLVGYSHESKLDSLQFFNFLRGSSYKEEQRILISQSLTNYLKVTEFLLEIAVVEDFFEDNNVCDFSFAMSQGRGIGIKLDVENQDQAYWIGEIVHHVSTKIVIDLKHPIFRELVGNWNSNLFFEQSLLSVHYLLDNPSERKSCIEDTKDVSSTVGEIFLKTLTMTALVDAELAPQESYLFNLSAKYFGISSVVLKELEDLIHSRNHRSVVKELKKELLKVDSSYYEMILRVISAVSKVDNIVREEEEVLLIVFSNYFSLDTNNYKNIGKINIFVKENEARPTVVNSDIEEIISIVGLNPGCTVKFLLGKLRENGINISKYQLNSHYKENAKLQKKLEKSSEGTWYLKTKK